MTRHHVTATLWAVAISVVIFAAIAWGQSGLSIPGDLAVTDDITAGDNLQVGGDSNVDGLSTMDHHSSSYLPQRTLIVFQEAGSTGKAFPDTLVGMSKRLYFYAPCAGLVYDFYFSIEGVGSAWDSLLVDSFSGVGADTSMLDVLPMLIPGDGAEACTRTDGRSAVMDAVMRNVDAGERVELWARLYGNKGDPPDGLTVYAWFQPDYGN